MKKIRFGLIGSGWRAEFYIRIAKMLPDVFDLAAVLIRDQAKGEIFAEKYGVNVIQTIDEFDDLLIEFVVLSIKREVVVDYLPKLYMKNIPVLCETPPSNKEQDLEIIWHDAKKYDGKIQIAEQYLFQPLYATWYKLISEGKLGEVECVDISAIHGYHAVYMMRKFLGINYENCKIQGKQYQFRIVKTGSRDGECYDGEIVDNTRERITLEFENDKIGYYDFTFVQYYTSIRTRQLNVQGTRGEIDDLEVRYLDENNRPINLGINRIDKGIYNNQGWEHQKIMLGDKCYYENPFAGARLNDDEIAIATCMYKMRTYVEDGEEFYGLAEALQDSYIAIKMQEAVNSNPQVIDTNTQVWTK